MGDVSAEIAGAAVTFLLVNLKQLLVEHYHLITGAKTQVEQLVKDLRFIKEFLMESTLRPENDIVMRELLRDTRDNIYEAEDIIDSFVTLAVETKSKFCLFRAPQMLSLSNNTQKVISIIAKIKTIRDGIREQINNPRTSTELGAPEEHQAPPMVRDNVVGFQNEENQLIEHLSKETQQLDVVSIIGMPGLGKTTLAAKIFHHPTIKEKFPEIRIWLYVSDTTKKNVFLGILRYLGTTLTEDMYGKSYEDLGRLVAAKLDNVKFLIVMDNVWAAEDWKKLQIAFPASNKMGKVLITSRNEEVARIASKSMRPIKLNLLSQDESWRLLQLQVFSNLDCPTELQRYGKIIAEQCDGLPLSIVNIGDILAKKVSESDQMNVRRDVWEKVSKSVSAYLSDGEGEKSIASSYNKLPYHLRACFLYLGMFPEDFEIPVSKLIHLWIAEGLVQQKQGLSLEENAENYLADLICRSLVRVEKKKPDGKTKTCRISYLVRDFCKTEAGNERENFLQELKKPSIEGAFQPPISDVEKYRRLCIHSDVSNFISKRPTGGRLRSFVCCSTEEIPVETEHVSTFPRAFKLLRVLDAKPIKFKKIPGDLHLLVHLRFISLSFSSGVLPAAFTKLWNVQTLIVHTTAGALIIKADILKMIQLRHLKTNVPATLPRTTKSNKEGEMLQTLGTISPKSCTMEFCEMALCLKKLSIRGRLALLLKGNHESFNALGKLRNLEKLKLLNDVHPSPAREGKLSGLPKQYQFPLKLRSLTLSATFLDWSDMSILGLLEKLEILKLKEDAFVGRIWEAAHSGFCCLEVLHIVRCTELVTWGASAHHFPKLRRLNLWNCEKLREVPIGLADIPTFQLLDLRDGTQSAALFATEIDKAKQRLNDLGQTANAIPFKLSISPIDG